MGVPLRELAAAAALAGLAFLAAVPAGARCQELTPQEQVGKRIYFEGESPSGAEIRGIVGAEGTSIPAAAVTCAGCHGDDGLGRPEGATIPSEVTWSKLTKPYGVTHPDGRKHPPYDDKTLARSITDGLDPAGNSLDTVMPRYSMPAEDLAALVAFMKKLESHLDPGVTLASVRLGTVLPAKGRVGEVGQAIRGILEEWFKDLNAEGGINGRKVTLEVAEYEGDAAAGIEAAKRLLAGRGVFALVSPFVPDGDAALAELAEREKIPLVGPFTPFTAGASGHLAFYVVAGVREQARALALHATREIKAGAGRCAVVHADVELMADAARAAQAQLARGGWKKAELFRFARGSLDAQLVDRLRERGTQVVLFLGGDADLAAFTRRAAAAGWTPHLLVPGVLVSSAASEAPAAFQGKILVAYPTVPSDEKKGAVARLAKLRGRAKLDERHRAAQVSAYAAASLVVEGLRRSGRNLSRERLWRSLEGLHLFETGLTPPLSYHASRRVGAMGAHVVAVDLQGKSFRLVGWRGIE